MSESVWWPEEQWWEKKSIPLGLFVVSFRQLVTIVIFALIGAASSIPVNFGIGGISFAGKAVILGVFLFAGVIVANMKVRLVPVEMQILYILMRNRWGGVGGAQQSKPSQKEKTSSKIEETATVQDLLVEDFEHPRSVYSLTDKLRVSRPVKVFLYVGGDRRSESIVTPDSPVWRFVYIPQKKDVGVVEVSVRTEGVEKPLQKMTLTVREKGVELLETSKK